MRRKVNRVVTFIHPLFFVWLILYFNKYLVNYKHPIFISELMVGTNEKQPEIMIPDIQDDAFEACSSTKGKDREPQRKGEGYRRDRMLTRSQSRSKGFFKHFLSTVTFTFRKSIICLLFLACSSQRIQASN